MGYTIAFNCFIRSRFLAGFPIWYLFSVSSSRTSAALSLWSLGSNHRYLISLLQQRHSALTLSRAQLIIKSQCFRFRCTCFVRLFLQTLLFKMVFPIVVNGAAAPIHVTEDHALLAPLLEGHLLHSSNDTSLGEIKRFAKPGPTLSGARAGSLQVFCHRL
jgi:hypothetical protein